MPTGSSTHPGNQSGDETLDLSTALRLVEDAETKARKELHGNEALMYLIWGLAWLMGFGTLHGSRFGWLPLDRGTSFAVFGSCILLGVISTIVMVSRYSRGIRGHSAFIGAMYGIAWALGFFVMGILAGIVGNAIGDFWLRGMLINGSAILIVGLLYITGGTTFNDKTQCYMGIWFLLVNIAAMMTGPDHFITVFFIFGSGGFLVGALVETLRRRRQRTHHA